MNGISRVIGGIPLIGEATPIPNKNSLMGALPLAMLTPEGVTYDRLPRTTDVECFLDLYLKLGATVEAASGQTKVSTSSAASWEMDSEISMRFRGAFSLTGPLLARHGKAVASVPGGCKLGARSLSTHIHAFKAVGVEVEESEKRLLLSLPRGGYRGGRVWLLEASVTATLNLAMLAAGADGDTEIVGASCEPHVVDVLSALVDMGAKIDGIGTHHLRISGSTALSSTTFVASPDFVDIAGYCVAAAVTAGKIRIKGANIPAIVDGILGWLELLGAVVEREGADLIASGPKNLAMKSEVLPLAGRDLPKLAARPWPGFPVDVLPVVVTLATKSRGSILIQNWMYETGFDFIRELNYLGADIFMADPQKIIVMEPAVSYTGGEVAAPGVIQGTKAIFLAALADDVETVIHGTEILRRRYPDIMETYRSLGAGIEQVMDHDHLYQ